LDTLTDLLQAYVNGAAASGSRCDCMCCASPPAYFPTMGPKRAPPNVSELVRRLKNEAANALEKLYESERKRRGL
jgi:hypothetical protein